MLNATEHASFFRVIGNNCVLSCKHEQVYLFRHLKNNENNSCLFCYVSCNSLFSCCHKTLPEIGESIKVRGLLGL